MGTGGKVDGSYNTHIQGWDCYCTICSRKYLSLAMITDNRSSVHRNAIPDSLIDSTTAMVVRTDIDDVEL